MVVVNLKNIPYEVTKIISKKGDELVNEKVSDDGSKYVKFLSIRSYNKSYKIDVTEIDENIEEQFQAIPKKQQTKKQKEHVKRKVIIKEIM